MTAFVSIHVQSQEIYADFAAYGRRVLFPSYPARNLVCPNNTTCIDTDVIDNDRCWIMVKHTDIPQPKVH
jgi:hypothetical protein